MNMASSAITIRNVRFSYCHLFQPQTKPGQDPKYNTTILLPKSETQGKALIDQMIAIAIEDGVNQNWNGVKPPNIPIPVYDGDGVRPSDGTPFGQECKGHWVFTASSKQQPFVVDANVQDIINPALVYSGMYGNVNVRFFPYNSNGRKGIGCGLNGVQKVSDGEPLDGRMTAAEAFQPVQPVPQAAASGYGQPPTGSAPAYNAAPAPSQPTYTPPPAAAPGYTPPPVNAAPAGYGAAPAAPNAAPGYGAAPAYSAAAPANGAYGAAYPASVQTQAPATPQPYVDPNTGEVVGGYIPNGMPIAGI